MEIRFWIVLLSIYLNENNNNYIYDMTIESTFMFHFLSLSGQIRSLATHI